MVAREISKPVLSRRPAAKSEAFFTHMAFGATTTTGERKAFCEKYLTPFFWGEGMFRIHQERICGE